MASVTLRTRSAGTVRFEARGGYLRVEFAQLKRRFTCYQGGHTLAGKPIAARPDNVERLARRWWRKRLALLRTNP